MTSSHVNRVGLLVIAVAFAAGPVAAAEIVWQTDAREAMEQAGTQGRPLLVFVTSRACPHCNRMERGTFRHAGVVRHMNQSFVALKVDADEQPMLVQRLRVSAFPSLLVVTPQRRLLAKQQGYLDPAELNQFLSLAVKQAETAERR